MPLRRLLPERCCNNCSMSLTVESTASGLRYAKEYYETAPGERKHHVLSHYPETWPTDTCDRWKARPPRVNLLRPDET